MTRRCRQPSRNGESFEVPTRGWSSIGTSRTSSPSRVARMTISDANSMPTVRRLRTGQDVAADRAHPAVRVVDVRAIEDVEEPREKRVAHPAEPGHRTRLDAAQAVPDDELRAVFELVHEARDLAEVVRQVGVDHDDVVAAGGGQPGEVRAPVAAPPLLDDQGSGGARELAAAVRRAVVDDDHLAGQSRSRRAPPGPS